MNKHLNPIFRDALNAFANPECAECKVLAPRHAPNCTHYVQPAPINWSADGFLRTAAAGEIGLIGNGLFVRMGKRRAA